MAFVKKDFDIDSNDEPRKIIPKGVYLARCFLLADIGTQLGSKQYPAPKRKFLLSFEIPSLAKDEKSPQLITQIYGLSNGSKSWLVRDLSAWCIGEEGDIMYLLNNVVVGRWANLTINHSECGKYANIVNISKVPDETIFPETIKGLTRFDFGNPDSTEFQRLPNWLQEKARKSPEWRALEEGGPTLTTPIQKTLDKASAEDFKDMEPEESVDKEDDLPF